MIRSLSIGLPRITPTPSRFARHLSPSKGERKGAHDHGRYFLSPVERGRGGARSATEWGSTLPLQAEFRALLPRPIALVTILTADKK
jgi:hypothetical protein